MRFKNTAVCGNCVARFKNNNIADCEITLVSEATANGLRTIAEAIQTAGGRDAVNLRVAEEYVAEFGKLAKAGNTMIIPSDLANVAGFVKAATSVIKGSDK